MKYKSTSKETTAQRLERIAKYNQRKAELAAKPKQLPIVPPYAKDPKWTNRLGGLNRSERYGPEGGPLDDF